ncbi:DUF350 domain-containing protein [Bacillus xiapuensis]|uniref:DUF350 domain-containing protein n=1 Tax=Bacillus xiapuensis TaxID=2014075 RepID=UPI000C24F1E4|nr:DUF350 domain-containing protein [Bacillus xiapuensis]
MNPFLLTLLYFSIAVAVVIAGLIVFELLTRKYKDWQEIKEGNAAVALSISGKIIGICLILMFSIFHNDTIVETLAWGAYGIVLQIIAYLLFDLLTRHFSVESQLKERNIAVGIISFSVSVGLACVIGASIS